MYVSLPAQRRPLRQLRPQQRRYPQMAAHEPPRENGRRAARQPASEKPEQEEKLSAVVRAV